MHVGNIDDGAEATVAVQREDPRSSGSGSDDQPPRDSIQLNFNRMFSRVFNRVH